MAKAKAKDTASPTSHDSPSREPSSLVNAPSAEQLKFAIRCIRNVTGCGDIEAKTRIEALDPSIVITIADLEKDGKRREAIAHIYS
jgi:ribosomal protein L7/L12